MPPAQSTEKLEPFGSVPAVGVPSWYVAECGKNGKPVFSPSQGVGSNLSSAGMLPW